MNKIIRAISLAIYNFLQDLSYHFRITPRVKATLFLRDGRYITPDDCPDDCLAVIIQFENPLPLRIIMHNLDATRVDEIYDLGDFQVTTFREYIYKNPEFLKGEKNDGND